MDSPQWFILNHIGTPAMRQAATAKRVVDSFNSRENTTLELFAPTIVSMTAVGNNIVQTEKPFVFHYVFVRGVFEEIKRLCALPNGFSFVINHGGKERYAIVSDRNMEDFRMIARAYKNNLPFLPLEYVDLEAGDKVEIIEGSFPGLVGYFIPKKKSVKGNIVLQVTQNLGTVAYDINAKYVRVLEFSKKSRRGYDQIDAFVPKLYAALRKYFAGKELSYKEIAPMTLFYRRMYQASFGNFKIEAKLFAILTVVCRILGDTEGMIKSKSQYDRRSASITSPETKAFVMLLEAVLKKDRMILNEGMVLLGCKPEKESKSLNQLREEYEWYNAGFQ